MRTARAAFKHAMRRCRREEEALRAEAMAAKLRGGDSRAFWRCVSASGGAAAATRPDRIDGAVGEEAVANLWATKFGNVLNSLKDQEHQQEFYSSYNKYAE